MKADHQFWGMASQFAQLHVVDEVAGHQLLIGEGENALHVSLGGLKLQHVQAIGMSQTWRTTAPVFIHFEDRCTCSGTIWNLLFHLRCNKSIQLNDMGESTEVSLQVTQKTNSILTFLRSILTLTIIDI